MDGSRFDAWTRRRFGLAAGGLVGSFAGLFGIGEDDAKAKKGKKKRCRKLGQSCKSSGKRACCKKKGLACLQAEGGGSQCCRRGQASCASDGQCCSGSCMDGLCQCKTNGMECAFDAFCCSLNCAGDMNATCQPA